MIIPKQIIIETIITNSFLWPKNGKTRNTMIRIQFDIDDDLWERMNRYTTYKLRHATTENALVEWLNRREARDNRLRKEQFNKDVNLFRPIIKHILEEG